MIASNATSNQINHFNFSHMPNQDHNPSSLDIRIDSKYYKNKPLNIDNINQYPHSNSKNNASIDLEIDQIIKDNLLIKTKMTRNYSDSSNGLQSVPIGQTSLAHMNLESVDFLMEHGIDLNSLKKKKSEKYEEPKKSKIHIEMEGKLDKMYENTPMTIISEEMSRQITEKNFEANTQKTSVNNLNFYIKESPFRTSNMKKELVKNAEIKPFMMDGDTTNSSKENLVNKKGNNKATFFKWVNSQWAQFIRKHPDFQEHEQKKENELDEGDFRRTWSQTITKNLQKPRESD